MLERFLHWEKKLSLYQVIKVTLILVLIEHWRFLAQQLQIQFQFGTSLISSLFAVNNLSDISVINSPETIYLGS